MTVAILSIGTELTCGEIVDTNAPWLAAELVEAGFVVATKMSVPDEVDRIRDALRMLAERHRVIVATGGLGPTSDDLTAAAAAEAAGTALARDESALLAIRRRVESRGRVVTPALEKQADVPEGAEILMNAEGTAPGFAVTVGPARALFMPGVPGEMRRMFEEQVLPRIRSEATNDRFTIRLRTFGFGESTVAQRLEGLEREHEGVRLGYRVHGPEVDVKIQARGAGVAAARAIAASVAAEARARLGDVVFAEGDESLPEATGRVVRARGWRLALAESCTGGLVSHLLTTFPGASEFLVGAAVTYANSAKTRLLGVSEDTLRGHGAVSAEVAAEMAEGARRHCDVDVALAITGIAGPGGGSAAKPVGLVHWAVAHPGGTVVRDRVFSGTRADIQSRAAYAALDLLRRIAAGLPLDPDVETPLSQRAPSR
jgi:nicotinamide-nucleotide amidase